jgi:hypothetical protein
MTNKFDGSDYDPQRDNVRLTKQSDKIFNLMKDGIFRTLPEISKITNEPPASISAQLRHFRKPRFGFHTVNKKYIENGLYSYQLIIKKL